MKEEVVDWLGELTPQEAYNRGQRDGQLALLWEIVEQPAKPENIIAFLKKLRDKLLLELDKEGDI